MSFDLYFYKKKGNNLSGQQIAAYLNDNLSSQSESDTQWFVEHEDTEAYFTIDQFDIEPEEDVSFPEFENTGFSFNLNYVRPDFFGRFAFDFLTRFIADLDLYVQDPQSQGDDDVPFKPKAGELYETWSAINAQHAARTFQEYQLDYYPLEKSNDFYEYNLHKERLQAENEHLCYVPKLYLFKRFSDGQIITISTWTNHIPNLFPPADYYLLVKDYRRVFRKTQENGLISRQTLENRFGKYMYDFDFKGCKIIYPNDAAQMDDLFHETKFEHSLKLFADRVQMDKLVNVMPENNVES